MSVTLDRDVAVAARLVMLCLLSVAFLWVKRRPLDVATNALEIRVDHVGRW